MDKKTEVLKSIRIESVPSITGREIFFAIEGNEIIKNLDINLTRGDILLLEGPNGSGKTTILRLISGVLECSVGEISVRGSLVYLSHKNACRDGLSVLQNLNLWCSIYKTTEPSRGILLNQAIETFSLSGILYEKYYTLSEGWKRRVALARLILSNSDIWLLDEPYSNLDPVASEMLHITINGKKNAGGIVVITCTGNRLASGQLVAKQMALKGS